MVIMKKNNTKRNKKIIIICVSILLLFLITITIVRMVKKNKQQAIMQQEEQRVKQYTSITDFKSVQEVALYLNCEFIKQEESETENLQYNIYMKLPIKPENSNDKNFYENVIQYTAYALSYKNFVIIDEQNETEILVYCNAKTRQVAKYYINNIENFFETKQSEENVENYTEITAINNIKINSNELNQIVNNNWAINNINIGTIESIYRGYDIYFDEGFEVRKINGKIFNIVFKSQYKDSIINNLKTESTTEQIEKTLGKPHFREGSLIGYKCKNMYVFFYENQVSIYRTEEYDTTEIAEIIQKYNSNNEEFITFINEVKNIWKDYDKYEYNGNSVILQYSIKGLKIQYNASVKQSVTYYNNFKGLAYGNTTLEEYVNKKEQLPSNVYIENEDLVFETEINRVSTLDNTTKSFNYASKAVLNISKQFKTYTKEFNNNAYSVRFISIGNKLPNSELRENINYGIWYDDYNFIYSVNGRGIFAYNAETRTYKTIVTGTDKFIIKKFEDNKLYYDDTSVAINL